MNILVRGHVALAALIVAASALPCASFDEYQRGNDEAYAVTPYISFTSGRLTQGDAFGVEIVLSQKANSITGSFDGTPVIFSKGRSPGVYNALAAASLASEPGTQSLLIEVLLADGRKAAYSYPIYVEKLNAGSQSLKLPEKMVKFDKKTEARITKERALMHKALSGSYPERRWAGAFAMPLSNNITTRFGTARILNGETSGVHKGVDINAKTGEEVRSAGDGVVALTGDFYLGGKLVIIDHGQGLFMSYLHMSKTLVNEGAQVAKGDVVGLAGATGRATGPHLHWGATMHLREINPLSIVQATESLLNNAGR